MKANVQLAAAVETGDFGKGTGGAFPGAAPQRCGPRLCAAQPCARLGAARSRLRNQDDVTKTARCYLTLILAWAPRRALSPRPCGTGSLSARAAPRCLPQNPRRPFAWVLCHPPATRKKSLQSPEGSLRLAPYFGGGQGTGESCCPSIAGWSVRCHPEGYRQRYEIKPHYENIPVLTSKRLSQKFAAFGKCPRHRKTPSWKHSLNVSIHNTASPRSPSDLAWGGREGVLIRVLPTICMHISAISGYDLCRT